MGNVHVTGALSAPVLKKAIDRYYKELHDYDGRADYELAVRTAFLNLLGETARQVKWLLIPEQTIEGNIRPDGVLRDSFDLKRGFWEAKGPKSDLDREIARKIATGYPLSNTIFENTKRAVLYQNRKRTCEYDLHNPKEVGDLLNQFLTYTEPEIASFEVAVQEFKEIIPDLAQGLLKQIKEEYAKNKPFVSAFASFLELCRSSIDPNMSSDTVNEMLVQHLLTERLFRTIFNNPDFTKRNVIASEVEKVIEALTSRAFDRNDFGKRLDRFYIAIENAAKNLGDWTEKQHFLNTVYERFFQGFSVKQADTHGIVYTPQEIVDFMCASVEEVLQREFDTSISQPGVQILDPCTGTGNFIVNILRRINGSTLAYKYANDLFCNEIMLLPYYIASLNIEHAYYERIGEYKSFEGICFADTLNLEGQQMELFGERNTERIQHEKAAQIRVVIGNPPYNAWQKSENDNNKNRRYLMIDHRVRETYAKESKATLKNSLYDAYVKFFRWATDRLQGRDGIICFISNNSFVDQIAFDGVRKHLLQDFTQIYHLDLHGNVRKNPKLSGTTHNVFGIQVGVGITVAVRNSHNPERKLYYYRVPEYWRKTEKLAFLTGKRNIADIGWQVLEPDVRHTWLTEGIHSEFSDFLPIGAKDAKAGRGGQQYAQTVFKTYSRGVSTSRDEWVHSFSRTNLTEKMQQFVRNYNSEVFRWIQKGAMSSSPDDFVNNDPAFLKWTDRLKEALTKKTVIKFDESKIRTSLYRPFCNRFLYFDNLLNQRRYQQHKIFPTSATGMENSVICVSGIGSNKPFHCLASDTIPCLDLLEKTQCFPYYTYSEDGSYRSENITDWSLFRFQAKYGSEVTKRDIFHYVYAMLHHPQYRERYAENLKRELPHIPLLPERSAFEIYVCIGKRLMELHLNYEQATEYPLKWIENREVSVNWHVEKMRLTPSKDIIVVNEWLTLTGIPQECFQYLLGNRSALEWVIDQYQVSTDARSGITSDPNREDEPEYIVRLVGRVITVSVETVRLVNELAQAVRMEDWMSETIGEQGGWAIE